MTKLGLSRCECGDITCRDRIFLLVLLVIVFTVIVVGLLNATRPLGVGTDSVNYLYYYNEGYLRNRFEPGFYLVVSFLNALGLPVWVFFYICYFSVISLSILFVYQGSRGFCRSNSITVLFCALGFIYSSSWFLTSSTNGLRQGIAVPLCWLAFFCFSRSQCIRFAFFILLAMCFHYSAVLLIPFAVVLKCSDRKVMAVASFAALGYMFGLNEEAVRLGSGLLASVVGYELYESIKLYGGESAKWVGFNLLFFIYTFFWFVFYYYVSVFSLRPVLIRSLWRIYAALMIMYFVFGFGGYSNRYALYCWQFLPILHAFFLATVKIDAVSRLSFSFLTFCVGVGVYSLAVIGF